MKDRHDRSHTWSFLLVTLLVLSAGCTAEEQPTRPPNIVFILIDDLGWADLPAYGNHFHETPNIDRMVREGMRFVNAYAAAPVCSPTRASIQSGQYPARVGVTDFITGHWRPFERFTVPKNRNQYLPLEIKTMAESLKEAGYITGYFGKWHLDKLGEDGYGPWEQGYDEAIVSRGGHFNLENRLSPPQEVTPEDYLTDVLTDKSLDFIETHKDRPFFLMLSHYAVHIPLHAKEALIQKYESKPKPDEGINNPIYAAMIEHVDESVGRILDGLDERGLGENTLVVFFSDNGGLRERFDQADGVIVSTNAPLRDEKGTLYEGGIRVPMIVRWPGVVAAGSTSEEIVSSVDLYPTFLAAAGTQTPTDLTLDGINIMPALQGEAQSDRPIFFHYPHYHHSTPAGAVRMGDYKLVEFFGDDRIELYNLANDIGESVNLEQELPEKTIELRQMLHTWQQSVSAEMPVLNPDFDESRRQEWGRHPDRRAG